MAPQTQLHRPTNPVLVLDWGGVLTTPVQEAFNSWLAAEEIDPDSFQRVMREYQDTADSPLHRRERGEITVGELEEAIASRLVTLAGQPVLATGVMTKMFKHIRPNPAMLQVVALARESGWKTAVLSNAWDDDHYAADLLTQFDAVVLSDMAGVRKPDLNAYEAIINALGVTAADCVFVDDMRRNVVAAELAGMQAIQYVPGVEKLLTDLITDGYRSAAPSADPRGLQLAPLTNYLNTQLGGNIVELSPELLPGGRSNVSYRLAGGDLGPLVLRRPPLGHILPTAHDMGREFKVLTGLTSVGFPVPRPIALCEDTNVIGAPFVLMEFVDGLVIADSVSASSLDPISARQTSQNFVQCLANLHNIDPVTAGLENLGKPAGYLPRQLSRWIKQWELAKKIDYPNADLLINWLQRAVTSLPEETKTSIVHGDYRLDNAIIDPTTTEIKAVLDWEMSTLGDPLLDVALTLLYMTESNDNLRNTIPIALEVTSSPGYYNRSEFLAAYCAITDANTSYLDFCLALSCFKLAAILESIKNRSKAGEQLGGAEHSGDLFGVACNNLLLLGLAVAEGDGVCGLNR
ncbi:MAG: HAD-IA family hydrolase [Actinomycetota bacterium]|nr:HAD-IA family hydrolase [Actinomycetota bacterium]